MARSEEWERGMTLAGQGDYRGAVESFKAALRRTTDKDETQSLWRNIAICHLFNGDLEEAEEAQGFAGDHITDKDDLVAQWKGLHAGGVEEAGDSAPSDEVRQQDDDPAQQEAGVWAADLEPDDGSLLDQALVSARKRFDEGDYLAALRELDPIVSGTIDRGDYGEEIWLYEALCHLYLGHIGNAEGYAAVLTGPWLDSYIEHRASVSQE